MATYYADHVQILHRLEDCPVGGALSKGIHFTKAAQAPIHDSDVLPARRVGHARTE